MGVAACTQHHKTQVAETKNREKPTQRRFPARVQRPNLHQHINTRNRQGSMEQRGALTGPREAEMTTNTISAIIRIGLTRENHVDQAWMLDRIICLRGLSKQHIRNKYLLEAIHIQMIRAWDMGTRACMINDLVAILICIKLSSCSHSMEPKFLPTARCPQKCVAHNYQDFHPPTFPNRNRTNRNSNSNI